VRQIAERLDVSVGTAGKYIEESLSELKETSRESADSWRQLQLARLRGTRPDAYVALASVQQGLKQSAAGKTYYLASFAQHAKDMPCLQSRAFPVITRLLPGQSSC